jgi:hypothetical protein
MRPSASSKKLSDTLDNITKTTSRPVRLFFQDEGRFGRISQLATCWGPVGRRPVIPAQHSRQYTYAYAAIEPKTGETASLMLPLVNTDAMNLHLAEIAKRYPDDHIALVLDGAAWHLGEGLSLPEHMTLIPLPPYSPELNPVEQLWKALRQNWFANILFDSMDSLETKLVSVLRWVENRPEWVKSFAAYQWILSVT